MPSADPGDAAAELYGERDRARLVEIALASLAHGLERGGPVDLDPERESEALRRVRASFVTLERGGALRGCIGSLEPRWPLARDVAENAFQAGFRDPRFPPLGRAELDGIDCRISVLGPRSAVDADSEAALLRAIEPGRDGLVLRDGPFRATFLPAVWHSLPDPRRFVRELKRKAGLPEDHWSPSIRFERYRTVSIP